MLKKGAIPILPKSILIVLLLSMLSCAPVISKQVREQVRPDITFKNVLNDPDRYKGQVIIICGIIIETENTKEGTLLKVLQRPAGFRGEPKDVDKSAGRFLALDTRLLDTTVFTKGRSVTIAGEVQGMRILPLYEKEYHYPLIYVKEIYLWPVKTVYHPYSYNSLNQYLWWRDSLLHTRRIPIKSR